MKSIHKIKLSVVLATGLVFSATSCKDSFFDLPALGALSDAQLKTRAGIDALLIGVYGGLDGTGMGGGSAWNTAADNWIYGTVAGGEAKKGSDGSDQAGINSIMQMTADASNGFFNSKWVVGYEGVNRANSVIKNLRDASDISDADKKTIEGEARFLRGHYYFDLKKMFGNIPWIDETTEDPASVPNDSDVWPQIEADFKFAYDNLPNTQSQKGRANKWAAGAYLGKAQLFQKKWAEAKATFDAVIANGVTSSGEKYGLLDRYQDNFNAATKNSKESVFAVQQVANDGTNSIANGNEGWMLNHPYNSPFRCCGFYQPSIDLANSFQTDAQGLPIISNYNSKMLKNDQGILSSAAFTPDKTTPVDPRLDWTVGRRGIPFHDWGYHPGQNWIRDQAYAGPYSPKKSIYWQHDQATYADQSSWAPGSAININIIRFADVLLMAAEAEAQLGNLARAQELVNMVRARAAKKDSWLHEYINPSSPMDGFSDTPASNYQIKTYPAGAFASMGKDAALQAIYFERKLELAMEGHRFFDLSRWGIAAETLNAYFAYEGAITPDVRDGKFTKGKNEVYPIPLTQIDLSTKNGQSTLKQNPGYN
ncbi:RagB/SusD family nutrient uptake outer membrane protein [Leadbetterella byssophila]|uniref:RagB/SusD domain protein n=1 Tax=Leadbetterella byssophila (strain DSM 17132 / JCM 16389 / KACC 11308 / NBRC 106382 / 4M15) TaxID=649349 RepID=E4RTW6_LEAB4|nr:RagB/SusD family nutrient uptake outer membrane protein [Leadbetterella byssophila]ADQ18674.1 RagB/SusD domain protein [Leadbetterella byssophila DSM 17132]